MRSGCADRSGQGEHVRLHDDDDVVEGGGAAEAGGVDGAQMVIRSRFLGALCECGAPSGVIVGVGGAHEHSWRVGRRAAVAIDYGRDLDDACVRAHDHDHAHARDPLGFGRVSRRIDDDDVDARVQVGEWPTRGRLERGHTRKFAGDVVWSPVEHRRRILAGGTQMCDRRTQRGSARLGRRAEVESDPAMIDVAGDAVRAHEVLAKSDLVMEPGPRTLGHHEPLVAVEAK